MLRVAGTFPIDLAKTRLQIQGQVGDSRYREIRYRGMLHAIVRIVREEGVLALYSGSVWGINVSPSQGLGILVVYGVAVFLHFLIFVNFRFVQ